MIAMIERRGPGALMAAIAAGLAIAIASPLRAQQLGYDFNAIDAAPAPADTPAPDPLSAGDGGSSANNADSVPRPRAVRRSKISAYVGIEQGADWHSRGRTVEMFTGVGGGVTVDWRSRRAEAQGALDYQHRLFWDGGDSDLLTGLMRGSYRATRSLTLDAGAVATRSTGGFSSWADSASREGTRVYSVYSGPAYRTHIGGMDAGLSYRLGYTHYDRDDDAGSLYGGGVSSQTTHDVNAFIGQRARQSALPFGWQAIGMYQQQHIAVLDQRLKIGSVRAEATYPLTATLALVGEIGYEAIRADRRDPLLDAKGGILVGKDGNPVTNAAAPRRLTYRTEGFIYDAGVIWRPSARTSLTGTVGFRYGEPFFSGSYSHRVGRESSILLSAYSGLHSYGGQLGNGLAGLPTAGGIIRNPLDNGVTGCTAGMTATCLPGMNLIGWDAFYRDQGLQLTFSTRYGHWTLVATAGYDRREYLDNGLPAPFNYGGVTDEAGNVAFYGSRRLDRRSSISLGAQAAFVHGGFEGGRTVRQFSANTAYQRALWRGLAGQASAGIAVYDGDRLTDDVVATGLIGLRYGF